MKTMQRKPQGFTLIELLVVMTIIAVLAGVGFSAFTKARETANKTNAIQNIAGNLKTALLTYASDNQDNFPDRKTATETSEPADANAAFRKLIAAGYVNDEAPFVIKGGAAKADGDTSTSDLTLQNGECHYSLAKGLTVTSNASYPLIWEAPVSGTWNPTWDSSLDRNEWGSTWSDGSIIVMNVGGAVTPMKIAVGGDDPSAKGSGQLAKTQGTKNVFELKQSNGDALNPAQGSGN